MGNEMDCGVSSIDAAAARNTVRMGPTPSMRGEEGTRSADTTQIVDVRRMTTGTMMAMRAFSEMHAMEESDMELSDWSVNPFSSKKSETFKSASSSSSSRPPPHE